jgi:hypothetical protein
MSDWYLDPPDEDEAPNCPACKNGYGEHLTSNSLIMLFECDECGHRWVEEIAQDPSPEDYDTIPYEYAPVFPEHCPHGKAWHECNPCMMTADLAYIAARETR